MTEHSEISVFEAALFELQLYSLSNFRHSLIVKLVCAFLSILKIILID